MQLVVTKAQHQQNCSSINNMTDMADSTCVIETTRLHDHDDLLEADLDKYTKVVMMWSQVNCLTNVLLC